jgi:hypothetical protein
LFPTCLRTFPACTHRDFYHNWTNSILQQLIVKIADALFRISSMTNSFKSHYGLEVGCSRTQTICGSDASSISTRPRHARSLWNCNICNPEYHKYTWVLHNSYRTCNSSPRGGDSFEDTSGEPLLV